MIPPNANFERLNPNIDAEFMNLEVLIQPHVIQSLLTYASFLSILSLGPPMDRAELRSTLLVLVAPMHMLSLTMRSTT